MNINEYDLELTVQALELINPRAGTANHIRHYIASKWPFTNLSTGGWVAYAENAFDPGNNNVRVALTPYSVNKYLGLKT